MLRAVQWARDPGAKAQAPGVDAEGRVYAAAARQYAAVRHVESTQAMYAALGVHHRIQRIGATDQSSAGVGRTGEAYAFADGEQSGGEQRALQGTGKVSVLARRGGKPPGFVVEYTLDAGTGAALQDTIAWIRTILRLQKEAIGTRAQGAPRDAGHEIRDQRGDEFAVKAERLRTGMGIVAVCQQPGLADQIFLVPGADRHQGRQQMQLEIASDIVCHRQTAGEAACVQVPCQETWRVQGAGGKDDAVGVEFTPIREPHAGDALGGAGCGA